MFAPDFQQPGLDRIRPKYRFHTDTAATQPQQTPTSQASLGQSTQQTSSPNSPSQQQYSTASRTEVDGSTPNKATAQYQQNQQQQYQQQQAQQQYQQQQAQQQYQQQQAQQQQYQQQQQAQQQSYQQQSYQSPYQQQMTNQQQTMNAQQQMNQQQYVNQQQSSVGQQQQQQSNASQSQTNLRAAQQQNYQNADSTLNSGPSTTDDASESTTAQEKSAALAQRSGSSIARGGRARQDAEPPGYSFQQAMSDHFDHYKRPPSRDSSVDRYTRAASRLRTPSMDNPGAVAAAAASALGGVGGVGMGVQSTRIGRQMTPTPGETPAPAGPRRSLIGMAAEGAKAGAAAGNGAVLMGVAAATSPLLFGASTTGAPAPAPLPPGYPPFEEVLLRKRGLGQDILPSLSQPKRTESLYIGQPAGPRPAPAKAAVLKSPSPLPPAGGLSRKKSLPDVQALPKATEPMSREEVSALGSMRREEMRRMAEESERLRANPLLYLISPGVKDWFSRQKLVMIVLFINISLAIMFFKLLT